MTHSRPQTHLTECVEGNLLPNGTLCQIRPTCQFLPVPIFGVNTEEAVGQRREREASCTAKAMLGEERLRFRLVRLPSPLKKCWWLNDLLGGRVRTVAGWGRTVAAQEGCSREGRRGRDVRREEEEGRARCGRKEGGRSAVRERGWADARGRTCGWSGKSRNNFLSPLHSF
jgi:hypothetical protein